MKNSAAFICLGAASALSLGMPSAASAATIYACKLNNFGTVRIVSATATCSRFETPISWDATGPQGPQGPQGPAGPVGPSSAYRTDNYAAGFTLTSLSGDANNPTAVLVLPLAAGNYILQGSIGLKVNVPFGIVTPFATATCSLSDSAGLIGQDSRTTLGGKPGLSYGTLAITGTVSLSAPDAITVLCSADGVGPVPVPGGTVNIDLATQPSTLIATQVGSISGN